MDERQYVPTSVFDAAMAIIGTRAQMACMKDELEALASDYLEQARTLDDPADRRDALRGFKIAYGAGWDKRAKADGLDLKKIEGQILNQPNDGADRWCGTFPLEVDAVRPPRGAWVVYQLLKGDDLVYIGSTGDLGSRVKAHGRTKDFDAWRAARCASEQECRDLEGALIDRHRPPLNRMIPTPRVVLA